MPRVRRRILLANVALVLAGLADLVTTLVWLDRGLAVEANPFMALLLRAGLPVFSLVKILTLMAFVAVMECYRRRHEERARAISRFTLAAYLTVYAVCFLRVNYHFFLDTCPP